MGKNIYILAIMMIFISLLIFSNKDNKKVIENNHKETLKIEKVYDFKSIHRKNSYNEEIQYYSKNNVEIGESSISIVSRKENKADKKYTSGLVESVKAYKYGFFEFEIRVSKGKGIFPAIWLMPEDGSSYPEIDIFEMIGSEPDIFYGVIHYEEEGKYKKNFFQEKVENKESYKVAIDWREDCITWYIDDEEKLKLYEGVPNDYMYLIVNQAIGGVWPGDPDIFTKFPSKFEILSYKIDAVYEKERE